ncbi:flagellar export chaperone FliS [Thiohalobacter thiocyanaticus]|uniref:Flagellar secretion chaperone FliS n=1 Tax=Thiohalobacter thiocyanaticus TaxID=585455 RepID=A0A426QGP7_9GAMM|nr:flagellar export chaperone FliS [Thiohalobacter thiocyanaticus]RRQ20929.1 flagella export chaperone FliS [Thiohalobacter thiocyanaticus]
MSYTGTHAGLQQYRQVNTQARIESASPHRLIQMLMQGALDRIATARGAMERGEIAAKGEQISWAISIVGGLRSSLDLEAGGELAGNLHDLYDYMERQLLQANIRNEVALLDEVSGLIREIKSAWDAVGDQPPQAVGG